MDNVNNPNLLAAKHRMNESFCDKKRGKKERNALISTIDGERLSTSGITYCIYILYLYKSAIDRILTIPYANPLIPVGRAYPASTVRDKHIAMMC